MPKSVTSFKSTTAQTGRGCVTSMGPGNICHPIDPPNHTKCQVIGWQSAWCPGPGPVPIGRGFGPKGLTTWRARWLKAAERSWRGRWLGWCALVLPKCSKGMNLDIKYLV